MNHPHKIYFSDFIGLQVFWCPRLQELISAFDREFCPSCGKKVKPAT